MKQPLANIVQIVTSDELIINVTCLEPKAAIDLFEKGCRRRMPGASLLSVLNSHSDDPDELKKSDDPDELKKRKERKELLGLISKCGGIPRVIVAIAKFLAPLTVTYMDRIRTLNLGFFSELESNTELFGSVEGIFSWLNSYIHACPDFLKRSILYLSIFPQYQIIRRRRLVMRWIAESYCKNAGDSSEEGSGEFSFSRLVSTDIVQQPQHLVTDVLGSRRMVSCQVNNLLNGYIISRAMEENLVLQLKGASYLTTQRTWRHLVIDSSWDRDKIVFESIDFSRLRSLTVFGRWQRFFISARMKVLRVLDLENTAGVTNKDLERMAQLLVRLRYLSLRGCTEICHLPSSLGGLRQLETLDVRRTSIITLPSSITKLKKLQYIRAGTEQPTVCSSSWLSGFCRRQQLDGSTRVAPDGVKVTPGIGKLTALHTLGVVNVSDAGGKDILKELNKLTQLRKLGVSGVNKKNIKEFWLPAWIERLHNLTKLDLEITLSAEVDTIRVLGNTRKLCILRLHAKSLQDGDVKLDFCVFVNGVELRCFEKLKILDLACITSKLHASFGLESMQNLELLTARCCSGSKLKFSGLERLRGLKEVRLVGSHEDELKVDIETQLREHRNQPSLKQVEEPSSSRRPHGYSA
ncbi:hypothetical protein PVAP13_1KG073100 [Panicum virgatum]|uniref:Uncharacterized protein n=1 Tax=Panicum virgatum TaxID=38727 RepID=A0A8T0XB60_PANVG|nr:hypothetical protein PVAP13_1KG073100 [Panicum virgatum]